ncbi:hypothetical protein ACLB2K_049789 [Fragaria x ananassa]
MEAADGGATKGMVHIRCCYNNKYLRRWDIDHHWIVAGGDKKVEDQTHWTCTLFEPVLETPADSDKDTKAVIRLRHVQLGRYVMQFTPHEDFKECLFPMSDKPYNGNYDLFEVLNWSPLVVLPKYVAFKGNNGKYLKADPGTKQLRFNSTDIGEEGVAMEVESFADGYVRIKGFKCFGHTTTEDGESTNSTAGFFRFALRTGQGLTVVRLSVTISILDVRSSRASVGKDRKKEKAPESVRGNERKAPGSVWRFD